MEKSKFAKIIDNFIYCVLIILFCILLCGIIKLGFLFQLVFGTILGVAIYLILFKIIAKSEEEKNFKKSELSHMEDIFKYLQQTNPSVVLSFLKNAFLNTSKFLVNSKKNSLVVTHKKTNNSFELFFNFFQTISLEFIFQCINQNSASSKKVILGTEFTNECIEIEKQNPSLILLKKTDCYNLFKTLNAFPKVSKSLVKRNRKAELKSIFSRLNIKKFWLASIVLWLISYFTTLKKYYRIVSILSLILGAIPLFTKKTNSQKNDNIKDFFDLLEKA